MKSTSHPRRILVRGVNWLGDAVMSTPALLRLREKFPEAQIALLTPEKLHDLWLNHPAIDEIISFAPGETVFSVAKKLRAGKFEVALVLPNSPRSGIEVFLAGIPKRVGYARPGRSFFLTERVAPRADAVKMRKRSVAEIQKLISHPTPNPKPKAQNLSSHQSHEYLHLAAALGANPEPLPPQLVVSGEEVEAAKKKFRLEDAVYQHPFFGINAGAEYGPAKRWPVERFIAAALNIRQRAAGNWIIFGGPGDKRIAEQIEQGIGSAVFNLAGQTSLRELMAVLKLCRVLLTNDTGPMHLAAALGTPVVAIFGSTSPELTGPIWSDRARIVRADAACSPCFLRECPIDFRCMKQISVEQVVETFTEKLKAEDKS
ncbi:MAG: lipopolysaccharide heptosyltransferase II [Limisphaerales bacterium]